MPYRWYCWRSTSNRGDSKRPGPAGTRGLGDEARLTLAQAQLTLAALQPEERRQLQGPDQTHNPSVGGSRATYERPMCGIVARHAYTHRR
jgi:hypothetical protein